MLNRCGKKTKRTVNDEDKQDNGEQRRGKSFPVFPPFIWPLACFEQT